MKRNILCTLAVMAACAILVACGKTDDQISPITPESNCLLYTSQKYGKRTSFSRNGSNLDITALAGYDLSSKV